MRHSQDDLLRIIDVIHNPKAVIFIVFTNYHHYFIPYPKSFDKI